MAQENLRELLAQLHARLENADSLDDESRKLLTTLSQDIERALGRASEETTPARNSLEGAAVQLEADHPALANIVRQLVDALGKAGI
jgi:uncharacterized phage infection (PIP) family protein YhgE